MRELEKYRVDYIQIFQIFNENLYIDFDVIEYIYIDEILKCLFEKENYFIYIKIFSQFHIQELDKIIM